MVLLIIVRSALRLSHAPLEFAAIMALAGSLLVVCARKVAAGRSWPRWLITAFVAVEIAFRIVAVVNDEPPFGNLGSRVAGLTFVLSLLLAAALMFTRSSNAWFLSRRSAEPPA